MHAHATNQAGRDRLDAQLAASRHLAAGDLGVSRLDEPIRAPAPARSVAPVELPPVTAPAIPEAPWSKLQPDARVRIEQAVAPALHQCITTLDGGVQAETARVQHQVANAQTEHDARLTAEHKRAQEELTVLRDTGARHVDTLRGRWQAENQSVRDRHATQAAAAQAAMESEIQDSVRAREHQCDAILTGAENESTATRSAANARAAAIRAQAESRAAAVRSRSSGTATMRSVARQDDGEGNGEAEARAILEEALGQAEREIQQAQQDIQLLIDNAANLTEEQVEHRLLQITARINQLKLELAAKVEAAISDQFPDLEAMYVQQIEVLLGEVRRNMFSVGAALIDGGAAMANAQLQLVSTIITARTERLQDTLEDAAVLSTFDDIGGALDAFHITMTNSEYLDIDGGQRAWNDTDQQLALAQAIRLENAFRAADAKGRPPGQQGLFERAGLTEPGEAFSAIMGGGKGITLHRETWLPPYTDEERAALLAADTAGTYGGDINNVPLYSDERDLEKDGAITRGGGRIDFYRTTGTASNDWIANATMFHLGHEFAHAFNQNILNAAGLSSQDGYDIADAPYNNDGTGLFQTLPITDASGNVIAGAGAERFTLSDATIARYKEEYGDDWQEQLQAASEAQGLRAGGYVMQNSSDFPDYLNLLPYQQNAMPGSSAEWFADIFVNWANGTLADTPGGAAIDQWMDDHMQDWIEMSLDANGLLP